MSWLPDGAPWLEGHPSLRAAGFLHPGHAHPRGDVPRELFLKLAALLVDPWQPFAVAGVHPCGFCRFTGGPGLLRVGTMEITLGARLLFVPDGESAWVAPSTILHSVDAHGYAPPESFATAVLACPEMRSTAYLRALVRCGAWRLRGEPDPMRELARLTLQYCRKQQALLTIWAREASARREGRFLIGDRPIDWIRHGDGVRFMTEARVVYDAHAAAREAPSGVDAWRLHLFLESLGIHRIEGEPALELGDARTVGDALDVLVERRVLRRSDEPSIATHGIFEPVDPLFEDD